MLDRLAGAERVEAGTFFGLKFEELEDAHRLRGGSDESELTTGGGEHHARRRNSEHLHATVREPGQDVNDVVVRDERVGECDERPHNL